MLLPAQQAFSSMCEAIADVDPETKQARGERIELLVPDERARADAMRALSQVGPRVHVIPYGDIWLRDTAPIFLQGPDGARKAAVFRFNGWGGKYVLPGDDRVARRIVEAWASPGAAGTARAGDVHDWVLEGGSVEVDGEGTVLTTRQCLLNPNRNPQLQPAEIEARLIAALGVEKVLWLDEGLVNDHTDGHVDTLARFVGPGVVVCMEPSGDADPNARALVAIRSALEKMTDARGRTLSVVRVPSPGRVTSDDGSIVPASYVNFYIGNRAVVVPTYGSPFDDAAVAAIGRCFPGRRTVGVDASAILAGGGAFHCITQQEPRGYP